VQGLVGKTKLRVERARARFPWVDIAVGTFKRYSEDDAGNYAAALTYYIFFSIFPLLLFAVSALGYLTFLNPDFRQDILDAGLGAFPLISGIVQDQLAQIEQSRGSFAVVGLLLALYSGSGAIVAMEHALNRLLRVSEEPKFVAKRIKSLKWLGALGLGAVLSASLGVVANFATDLFGEGSVLGRAVQVLGYIGGFVISVGLFATSFKVLPAKKQSWRQVLPGAIAAAVGFEILKSLGTTYFRAGASSRSATFGTMALAAGLLVASYLVAQITLLAAELNAYLRERRLTRKTSSEGGAA
jgi:membrane protein